MITSHSKNTLDSDIRQITKSTATVAGALRPCLLVGFTSRRDVTGLALAFDVLIAGMKQRSLPYRLLDFGQWGLAARPGTLGLRRVWQTLQLLFTFCIQLVGVQAVYILIASSLLGFLRDAWMIWLSRFAGRRLVLHLNGGGYRAFYEAQPAWRQQFIAQTLAQADAIIVLGEQLRDQFTFVPNHATKLQVIPNGLPLDLQSAESAAKSLPCNSPLRLLYLSNMIESKGYLTLLAACRILHHEYQLAVQCDFCGSFIQTAVDQVESQRAASERFSALITAWELADVVTYHGVVRGKKKEQFLRDAHLLVLPTLYPWEGQPICIIEALAFGTPVIATPHRGIPEQVVDAYNGFLVDADPQAIAAAIAKVSDDPQQYRMFSQNARSHFAAHFTQNAYLDRLIPVIVGQTWT